MGTGWSLLAPSPPAGVGEGVQAVLDRVVAQMSQWEPQSDIARFNRAPAGEWRMIPPEFARVLGAALAVAEGSGGAFDPAMGALSDLWGFGAATAPNGLPDGDAVRAAVAGKGAIECDGPALRARRTGTGRLDFSGIAKGFGVDLAAEWLLGHGVRDFLLDVGGELRGEGAKPDGQPWWVDIEPAPAAVEIAPIRVALHGLSVATSGNYRRWLDAGGKRYSHTLDPRSGWPVEHGLHSVTVFHRDCMMADAWATALTVLGPEEGLLLAECNGLATHMHGVAGELMSTALREMLD